MTIVDRWTFALRRAILIPLTLGLCIAVAGCGGGGDTSSGGGGSNAASSGGTLTADFTASPDFMDPALSLSYEGFVAMWNVYTPLLTYAHAEGEAGTKLIPGLATSMPKISKDGLTYTLKLRSGLKYSSGQPVKASDFTHALKRTLFLQAGGSFRYVGIEGAEQYIEAGKADADISGIKTDDKSGAITIHLSSPDGSFVYALAALTAAPVPSNTPFKNLSNDPPPGVGAYEISKSVPNQEFTLVKNPSFAGLGIPNIPAGKVDEVHVTVVTNQTRQIQDVLQNKVDWVFSPPPTSEIPTVTQQAKGRYEPYVAPLTFFVFMNERLAPFNDQKAREAVNVAIDRGAVQRLFGGLLTPTCNFLPPGVGGYEKMEPCPYGELGSPPDVAKARELISEAGDTGAPVTVWGNDESPSGPVTEYIASVMNEIGLKATPKIINKAVYFQTIGNQNTHAQAGWGDWAADNPSGSIFMPIVDGETITETNNLNFGNTNDPEINRLIKKAAPITDQTVANPYYTTIDKDVVEGSYLAPLGNSEKTKLVSENVDFESVIANPFMGIDISQIALR